MARAVKLLQAAGCNTFNIDTRTGVVTGTHTLASTTLSGGSTSWDSVVGLFDEKP